MSDSPPIVVGIGASAGGLDALQTLLRGIRPGHGLAFVVVFRLDPHASPLEPDLLAEATELPVVEATSGMAVAADHVYTAPAHRLLGLECGVFQFVAPDGAQDRRTPIDHFLQSLAHDQQNRAVGVILSGAGSDGAQGIKAVRDSGGMTIVQDPSTAGLVGMPRSACELGGADHVLPPEAMPDELVAYAEQLTTSKEEVQAANETLSSVNTDLENLLASTRVGTLFLDEAGLVRRVTPAARAIYNLRPGDVGRPLSDITHKAVFMPPLPPFREVRALGRIEDEIEMKDGTWFLRRILPYRTAEGVTEGAVVTFTDVTELKQAESLIRETLARLSASERLYRAIGESIDFGVWVCEPDGRNRYFSDSFLSLVGMTQEECSGFGWTKVLHPDDLDRTLASWKECVAREGTWDAEHRFLGTDGRWHPVLARGVPVRDENGRVFCWAGINLDIARQKAAEAALEESLRELQARSRELQSIADNTPDVLARFDRQHRYVFVNAAAERITGKPWQQFIGKTNQELGLPDELCTLWDAAIERVFTTGQLETVEFSYDPDGEQGPVPPRYFRARIVPERDSSGQITHVLGVSQDITATREAEEALREADRRKDEFLAILAHELRNPLAPVRTGLRLLESMGDGGATASIRKMMERQLAHMVRLVDDLLDVSRIARGMIELKRAPIELKAIVETAVEASRPTVEAARHELTLKVAPEPLWVDADLTRLAQVVNNLIVNAAKFTPEGGGHITLTAEREGEQAVIRITDNGIGIAPDMLPRVFEMFVQAHRSIDRAHGGLGIGLSLARRLVEMHGGSITVESDGLGRGTTSIVRLPLLPTLPSEAPPSEDPQGSEPTPVQRLQVLVVDDNLDGADSMSRLFELLGHKASVAHTGPQALEIARSLRPQVIFLDIGLPGMSGYEVARRLRADPEAQGTVLVAVTGWGSDKDRQAAREAGFDHHLVKPVDPDLLLGLLESIARGGAPN